MEMTDRKKQILKIVTEGYIQSAEPIGSKTVVERMPGKISSATVRNELADLEEMGYLEQPHTSAGRIPSAKGYRLYVNELMEHKTVTSEEAEKITSALGGRMQQIDQVVARAGQMASALVATRPMPWPIISRPLRSGASSLLPSAAIALLPW